MENRPKIDWNKKYTDNLPQIGQQCPACQVGFIIQGKYDLLCMECHTVFKINTRGNTTSGTTSGVKIPSGVSNEKLEDHLKMIFKELIDIKSLINSLVMKKVNEDIDPKK